MHACNLDETYSPFRNWNDNGNYQTGGKESEREPPRRIKVGRRGTRKKFHFNNRTREKSKDEKTCKHVGDLN
jgi:hypothetical protein